MIVPSIDIMGGRAVQLRRGKEFVLDGGDPLERLAEFAVAGEVAVVDLDAALGRGSNAAVIREMVRRAPCRVGGGIRDQETARQWLDAGAARVIIGTAASVQLCGALPRERVIAAVDAERGEVVVDGWRARTGTTVLERVRALSPVVSGFLFTQVEREGEMAGFDRDAIREVVAAAGAGARVTAAGGITTAADVAELDRVGADAQVGMALYTGRLSLGAAVSAPLTKALPGDVWPTVVCDESGKALGLVWSTRESVTRAVSERRGIYWSRSRGALWVKGQTSGAVQELVRVDLDCDRDALRFTVRQRGAGFCHLERPSCWSAGSAFDFDDLATVIAERAARPPIGSGTARLLADPDLLAAKLREETDELAQASSAEAAVHETADVLFMALVTLVRAGGTLRDVRAELARRHGAVTRRPMTAHEEAR